MIFSLNFFIIFQNYSRLPCSKALCKRKLISIKKWLQSNDYKKMVELWSPFPINQNTEIWIIAGCSYKIGSIVWSYPSSISLPHLHIQTFSEPFPVMIFVKNDSKFWDMNIWNVNDKNKWFLILKTYRKFIYLYYAQVDYRESTLWIFPPHLSAHHESK